MRAQLVILSVCRGFAAAAAALWLAAGAAHAVPVTVSFAGTVSGGFDRPFDPRPLIDYPIGTPVSRQFRFDDRLLPRRWDEDTRSADPTFTGFLTVGADRYAFTSGDPQPSDWALSGEVCEYQFWLRGLGPATGGGGDLFGLFAMLDRSLALTAARVGYGFTTTGPDFVSTSYGYLVLAGDYGVVRGHTVPEPSTAWLLLPAVALLAGRRRAGVPDQLAGGGRRTWMTRTSG